MSSRYHRRYHGRRYRWRFRCSALNRDYCSLFSCI